MALFDKNDLKNQAIYKANLKEIAALYKRLGDTNPFEDLKVEDIDASKFKEIKEYLNDAREEANGLYGAMDSIKEEVDDIFAGLNAVTDEITKGKQGFALTKKTVKALTGIIGDVKDITDGIVDGNSADLEKLLLKAQVEEKNLSIAQSLLQSKVDAGTATAQEEIALINVNGILERREGLYDKILDSIGQVITEENEVEAAMGNVGVAVKSVDGALKKLGMGALGKSMGLEDALTSTKALQKAAVKSGAPFNAMTTLTAKVAVNLKKAYGPLALALLALDQLVKAFKVIDKSSGEIAKTQGISAEEGRKLVNLANQQALASGDVLYNTKDIIKAQSQLNSIMGTSMQFPAQMSVDMNIMSEKLGLSANAQNLFAKNAIKGGTEIKEQLQSVSDITTQLNQQNGLTISQKSIQEGLTKLSASQRVNARGSSDELANQVYQSRLLGLSAQDLQGVQNSLLDFESSIAAEMEAELMTGKQLNLEGARAAALAGDQAALAVEIRKEVGTAAEFADMDVLSRQALAKAFGLNIDQMSEMLEKQKVLDQISKGGFKSQSEAQEAYNKRIENGMGHEEALADMKLKGIDDALAAQMKSATQSERMSALTERLSDLFIGLAGPLMTILDPMLVVLTEIVSLVSYVLAPAFKLIQDTVEGIKGIFSGNLEQLSTMETIMGGIAVVAGTFYATMRGISAVQGVITLLKAKENTLSLVGIGIAMKQKAINMGDAAISVIRGAYQTFGPIPFVGAIIAATAAAAGIAYLSTKAKKTGDLSIDPNGGPVVSSPQEGTLFQGTKNDGVSMGPGEGLSGRSGGGGSADMGEVTALLKQLINAVNSGGDVFLDGNKVGQALVLATSRMGN